MTKQKKMRISRAVRSMESIASPPAETERKRDQQGEDTQINEHKSTERQYPEVVEDQTEVTSRFREAGTFTFVNEVYCSFLRKEGHLKEIQSVGRDISEYKQMEETLRERDEFTNAILDSVSSHIAVLDTSGIILAVNEPWRRFAIENSTEFGRPARHTEVGVDYLEVCRKSHGESSEGAMTAHDGIRAVLDGLLPHFSLEYPCHSPGEQRWFIMTVTPLGTTGKGAVISHTNITQRKLAELALRDNEERYHSLFSSSMYAVMLTAPDGRIPVDWTRRLRPILE